MIKMNPKICLITFCGLDGSGKTTQATKLIDYMKKNKIDCEYVWLRAPEKLTLPFSVLLRILGLSKTLKTESGKRKGVTDLSKHKLLQKIWKKLLFLDLKFVSWYKIKRPLKKGKVVVVDRYVIDTLVDLVVDTKDESVIEEAAPTYLKILPSNSQIVFLDIDPETSYERNKEENFEILNLRRSLYLKLENFCNMTIIDSKKSVDDIHSEILNTCKLNNLNDSTKST